MLQEARLWKHKLQEGAELGKQFWSTYSDTLPRTIKNIAFAGMGGSGVAGRVLKTLLDLEFKGVTTIIEGTVIPRHIDQDSFVIVSTYSGDTWETLKVLKTLIKNQIPTMLITRGGKAAELAQQCDIPWIKAPESKTPRSALGSFLGMLLMVLEQYRALEGNRIYNDFISHIEEHMGGLEDQLSYKDFLELAIGRDGFHVWGIAGDSAACAYRAQTQFNENSKIQALASSFPELCHNLVVGFTKTTIQPLVVMLQTKFLSEFIYKATEATEELLREKGVVLYKPRILGDTFECQLLHIILWADFASCYLGQARGVSLEPVVLIDELKEKHKQKGITV